MKGKVPSISLLHSTPSGLMDVWAMHEEHTHLKRDQMSGGISRYGDVGRTFPVVGHKNVDRSVRVSQPQIPWEATSVKLYIRLEPIYKLPVFQLLLDKAKFERHHDVHQPCKKRTFFRTDDLAVHLLQLGISMNTARLRNRPGHVRVGRTGRSWGEMILLIMGANSVCRISALAKCRYAPSEP